MGHSRRTDISILKGIGILLMVIGHAGAPRWFSHFLYTFHMPLFFMASGYFFSPSKADEPWTFVGQRFRGFYLPFLKWSLFFLLMHNLLFMTGILTSVSDKGLYSFDAIVNRVNLLVFTMSGYEPHLLGAAWFMRALLLVNLLFMGLYSLLRYSFSMQRPERIVTLILLIMLVVTAYLRANNIRLSIPQGGYRECAGLIFFCIGYLFHRYENQWVLSSVVMWGAFVLVWGISRIFPVSLSPSSHLSQYLIILCTGFLGWTGTYILSRKLVHTRLAPVLEYLGTHSLIILFLHFLAFKLANVVKIIVLNLDWQEMGRHTMAAGDLPCGWLLYTACGILLPLGVEYGLDRGRSFLVRHFPSIRL